MMRVAILLCSCLLLLNRVEGAHPKCKSLCLVCKTLHHTKVNQICSSHLLEPCSCSEFVVANVTAGVGIKSGCPQPEAFCPFGHELSPSGCPSDRCHAAAGCPARADWASRCGPGAFCPAGYRTDSTGCPTCDCVCEDPKLHAEACASACGKAGGEAELLTHSAEGACPLCVCSRRTESTAVGLTAECNHRCTNSCGAYGHVNTSRDEHGCIADCSCKCPTERDWSKCPSSCPLTWSPDEFGCPRCRCATPQESRSCPPPPSCSGHSCGPYGFRVSPVTGCRENCNCNCPPSTPAVACPSNCQGEFDWSTNEFGCAVCRCSSISSGIISSSSSSSSRCPAVRCGDCGGYGYKTDSNGCTTCECNCPATPADTCKSAGCQQWTTDAYGCSVCAKCKPATPCIKKATAAVAQLCKGTCKSFVLTEDEDTGCLSCTCQAKCPPEPRCLIGCGPHPRKRDASGCVSSCDCDCPKVTLAQCSATCSYNASVAKDAYGCYQCKCDEAPRCPLKMKCARNCGAYGFEADARGCQVSCRCNCPKRNCGCFFGSKTDSFGCETCQCVTLQEYLNANSIGFTV